MFLTFRRRFSDCAFHKSTSPEQPKTLSADGREFIGNSVAFLQNYGFLTAINACTGNFLIWLLSRLWKLFLFWEKLFSLKIKIVWHAIRFNAVHSRLCVSCNWREAPPEREEWRWNEPTHAVTSCRYTPPWLCWLIARLCVFASRSRVVCGWKK